MANEKNSTDALWVTEFSTEAAIQFHQKAWEMFIDTPNEPLVIYIDSPGGEVNALLNMMGTMDSIRRASPEQFFFITYVQGDAISCGINLLAHGDLRVMEPKSELMYHNLSAGTRGREHNMANDLASVKKLGDKVRKIFIENTGFKGTVEELYEWGKEDRWLTSKEAIAMGIVDMIGSVMPRTVYTNPVSICDLGKKTQLSYRKHTKKIKTRTKK